jgi:hypothetical protein
VLLNCHTYSLPIYWLGTSTDFRFNMSLSKTDSEDPPDPSKKKY